MPGRDGTGPTGELINCQLPVVQKTTEQVDPVKINSEIENNEVNNQQNFYGRGMGRGRSTGQGMGRGRGMGRGMGRGRGMGQRNRFYSTGKTFSQTRNKGNN